MTDVCAKCAAALSVDTKDGSTVFHGCDGLPCRCPASDRHRTFGEPTVVVTEAAEAAMRAASDADLAAARETTVAERQEANLGQLAPQRPVTGQPPFASDPQPEPPAPARDAERAYGDAYDGNTAQTMADHPHGLRFVDDDGRCLACAVAVLTDRLQESPPGKPWPGYAEHPLPMAALTERGTGLLWFINRHAFHPVGYALTLHFDDDSGEFAGWSVAGNGAEVWTFSGPDDDAGFAKTKDWLDAIAELGFDDATVGLRDLTSVRTGDPAPEPPAVEVEEPDGRTT